MLSLPTLVQTALSSDNVFYISLFELGGNPTLHFTNADRIVRYNNIDWLPRGISHATNKETLSIDSASYEIVIENYDDEMTAWASIVNPNAYISTVYDAICDGTTDTDDRLVLVGNYAWQSFSGRNTNLKFDTEFSLNVKTFYDMSTHKGPAKEQNNLCRFRGKNGFKGRNCGYSGPETECNYTHTKDAKN